MIALSVLGAWIADVAVMADAVSDNRQPYPASAAWPVGHKAPHPVSQTPETSDAFTDAHVVDLVAYVRHHVGSVSPELTELSAFSRSVPALVARDAAASSLPRFPDAPADRAAFFDAAAYPPPDHHSRIPS